MHTQPICIIDDDGDDREMMTTIVDGLNLPNELRFFSSSQDFIRYLETVSDAPFIILSEVNLPGMDGFALRQQLLNHRDKKFHSVPFIFWSGNASEEQIRKAYDLSAHGFFIKPLSYTALEEDFRALVQYWRISRMPAKR